MDFVKTTYDKHLRMWSGPPKEATYDRDCSIGKMLHMALKNYPNNVLQINDVDGRKVTNNEALVWSTRIAQRFKKMRLRHDDVIGIVAKNSTYVMPTVVACFMNCTPFHSINPSIDESHMKHLFGLTKPKVVFCDGDMYEKVRNACSSFQPLIYTLLDHREGVPKVEDLLEAGENEWFYKPESLVLGGEQTVAILCSSGTTGMPKAVCLSNHSLVFDNFLNTSEDVLYTASGVDWYTGLYIILLSCNVGSTRIISSRPHTPEYFVELVKKYKITYAVSPPRHVSALLACPSATPENLSSIIYLMIGGGSISFQSLQQLQTLMKQANICFGYGLTEAGGVAANFGLDHEVSSGKLLPGVRARIIDDNGQNVGPNEVGEICVHNGLTWNGYYANPMETQRIQDSRGWIYTGDLGYFDEKDFLFIVDRKKDIMKYQGMHYWPGEIENVISKLPDVQDVSVVGLYDEAVGDKPAAAVVKKAGSKLSEEEVKAHVAKHLEQYKHLHGGVMFVDKLPQNANGKTLKRGVKELFGQK